MRCFLNRYKYTTTSICNKKCYNKFKLINYSSKILNSVKWVVHSVQKIRKILKIVTNTTAESVSNTTTVAPSTSGYSLRNRINRSSRQSESNEIPNIMFAS